jgi:hypothetical protein
LVRIVLIVGAGGSLAQASSYRQRQTREHPPLDADFFSRVLQLSEKDSALRNRVQALRRQLGDEFQNPLDGEPPAPLEQFFADVYYEVATHRSATAFEVFKTLLRLYLRVLARTTNWMAVRRDEGVLGKIMRSHLTAAHEDQLTVITFNQDLVLENIVARLPRTAGTWCLEGLYGDPTITPVTRKGANIFPLHQPGCQHRAPIRLLKLHGSLNWTLRTSKKQPTLATLFPTDRDKPIYLIDERQAILDVAEQNTGVGPGRRTWFLWPLIVPPIYDKQRITGMTVLQNLWDQAEHAVRDADRLVLLGYSLPEADVLARQMLRRGFLANRLTAIDCINPNVEIAAKLKQHLACKVVRLFHDAGTYLEYWQ